MKNKMIVSMVLGLALGGSGMAFGMQLVQIPSDNAAVTLTSLWHNDNLSLQKTTSVTLNVTNRTITLQEDWYKTFPDNPGVEYKMSANQPLTIPDNVKIPKTQEGFTSSMGMSLYSDGGVKTVSMPVKIVKVIKNDKKSTTRTKAPTSNLVIPNPTFSDSEKTNSEKQKTPTNVHQSSNPQPSYSLHAKMAAIGFILFGIGGLACYNNQLPNFLMEFFAKFMSSSSSVFSSSVQP